MNNAGNIKHVFPGSNTPQGFYSFFSYILSQKDANKLYVIKGGPGTGKSTFMKRIGNYMVDKGIDVEFFHCSSDPNSLDALCIPSLKVALLDGTAPHVVDPIHPGAIDAILNFGTLWDEEKIRVNRDNITECTAKISSYFKKSYCYLASAKSVYDSYILTESSAINHQSKITLENEIMDSIFKNVKAKNSIASDRHLFSSAITPEGFLDYLHTIIGKSKNIYFLKETLSCNSKQLMKRIADQALHLGYNIECYHSPIDVDKLEDILIPDLNIAITTSNQFHKAKVFPTHIFDFTSCLDTSLLKDFQNDLDREKKLMVDLFDKATNYIHTAHKLHDVLETYYVSAIDFTETDSLFENVVAEIMNFAE